MALDFSGWRVSRLWRLGVLVCGPGPYLGEQPKEAVSLAVQGAGRVAGAG
jgi:hypothetical protein